MKEPKVVYTVKEITKMLGISRNACYKALKKGELPCIRLGNKYLIPRAALEKLLENGANKPGEDRIIGITDPRVLTGDYLYPTYPL